MTTDREILEAAARAAGNGAVWYAGLGMGIDSGGVFPTLWKPRENLADAAALMLKLKLRVDYVDDQPCIDGVLQHGLTVEESFCRAVTRAAAALAPAEPLPVNGSVDNF